jgi:hypothetical protein
VFPLSDEIRNWKKREGSIKESVWLSQGIRVFRRLLAEDPSNVEYKTDLAKLLIRSGTDEKLKYVNLMTAKDLFAGGNRAFPQKWRGVISLRTHLLRKQ